MPPFSSLTKSASRSNSLVASAQSPPNTDSEVITAIDKELTPEEAIDAENIIYLQGFEKNYPFDLTEIPDDLPDTANDAQKAEYKRQLGIYMDQFRAPSKKTTHESKRQKFGPSNRFGTHSAQTRKNVIQAQNIILDELKFKVRSLDKKNEFTHRCDKYFFLAYDPACWASVKKEHGAKFCDKLYKLYKSMMPLDIRGDVDMSEWELDMSDRMRAKLLAYYQDYQKEGMRPPSGCVNKEVLALMRVDRQKKLAKLRAIDISEMKGHMRPIPSTLTVAALSPAPDAVAKPSPQSAKSTQATQATPRPNVSSDQGPPNVETITRPTAQVQSILHAGSLNTLKIGTAVNVTLETAFWHLPEDHECFRPKADDDDSDEDDTTSPF